MSRPYFPEYFDDEDLREMRRIQSEHNRRVEAWFQRNHVDSHTLEPPEDDPFPQQPEF